MGRRNLHITISLIAILLGFNTNLLAQCTVSATANPLTIVCGDTVNLAAIANDGITQFGQDFEAGLGGWTSTSSGFLATDGVNDCGKPTPNGTKFLWFGGTSNSPRYAQSPTVDIATGGSICFYMRYSAREGGANCEDPDQPNEGVALQYSINGGASWVTMQYWDPLGGGTAPTPLNTWNQYCITIPAAASVSSVIFRWLQTSNTGDGITGWLDHWGIDGVQVIKNNPSAAYTWAHTGVTQSTGATPPVIPTSNTTYTINYANGVSTCSATVSVVVTKPTATAYIDQTTVCPGTPINLDVTSTLKANPPTSCGANGAGSCTAFSSVSDEKQLGTGTTLSQTGNPGIGYLGASNFDGAVRSQFLIKASALTAAGITAGKFISMSFDIASNDAGSKPMNNFEVTYKCTSLTALPDAYASTAGGVIVHTAKTITVATGWHTIYFDNGYDWDGTTNILINICWKSNTGATIRTRHYATSPSYVATTTDGTNTAGTGSWDCADDTDPFTTGYTTLPNFKFGFCKPSNAVLSYSWTSTPAGFTSTTRNPTTTPTVSTTYQVDVNAAGRPVGCATTSNAVAVNVVTVTPTITPTNPAVCPPTTPNVALSVSGASTATYSGTLNFSSGVVNLNFPDNNTTGVTSNVTVANINPTTLPSNPIVSVCVNATMNASGSVGTDCATRQLKLTLTTPGGTNVVIYNGANNGAALNGCFTANYALANPFPTTGNINGVWRLKAEDMSAATCGSLTNNSPGGRLVSWSINFNTNQNYIASYQWINTTTGLSSTTSATPTATPTAATTYTVRITDAVGCTATQNVVVDYCTALPVSILNINAVRNGKATKVTWSTAQEENNVNFQIERSVDGLNFSNIGLVQGAGTSNTRHDYTYYDKSPSLGCNYYRIKQTDLDGKFTFTRIVSVFYSEIGQGLLLESLAPIPAKDVLSFTVQLASDDAVDVELLDMSGKIFRTEKRQFNAGRNISDIDVSQLSSGVYMLRVTKTDGTNIVRRFVK